MAVAKRITAVPAYRWDIREWGMGLQVLEKAERVTSLILGVAVMECGPCCRGAGCY